MMKNIADKKQKKKNVICILRVMEIFLMRAFYAFCFCKNENFW